MKKLWIAVLTAAVFVLSGSVWAQDDTADYFPIEGFTCTYNDGMGPDDLEEATQAWSEWADEHDVTNYWAGTLTPYYYGPEQTFDWIWLGGWTSGTGMGTDTDLWLGEGGAVAAKFFEVASCDSHTGFAATMTKSPPDSDESDDTLVLSFQDCKMTSEDPAADPVAVLTAWGKQQEELGFVGGTWVFWPIYGGGGAEYDFKLVTDEANYAQLGANWDLWEQHFGKYMEMVGGMYQCDDARVYNTTVRRRPADSDD